jgi:hypothetical protein
LQTASVFCLDGKRAEFGEARYCDLSEVGTEAIEPGSNADGGDRKVANGSVINSFDPAVPQGDARRRKRPFTPHPPGNECCQMKADRFI